MKLHCSGKFLGFSSHQTNWKFNRLIKPLHTYFRWMSYLGRAPVELLTDFVLICSHIQSAQTMNIYYVIYIDYIVHSTKENDDGW